MTLSPGSPTMSQNDQTDDQKESCEVIDHSCSAGNSSGVKPCCSANTVRLRRSIWSWLGFHRRFDAIKPVQFVATFKPRRIPRFNFGGRNRQYDSSRNDHQWEGLGGGDVAVDRPRLLLALARQARSSVASSSTRTILTGYTESRILIRPYGISIATVDQCLPSQRAQLTNNSDRSAMQLRLIEWGMKPETSSWHRAASFAKLQSTTVSSTTSPNTQAPGLRSHGH